MRELYPLQIVPEFVERVWGTRDVGAIYQHSVGAQPIGEVWLTGEQCRVANGPLKGRTIAELCAEYGDALIGEGNKTPNRFPLLMKVLFPREKLSVQVHPDDEAAQRVGEPCGKTECWYILSAEPGAQIGLGLKPGTSRAEVERSIHENRMEQLLNWIDVHPGEMFYVDAGTVHAIGPGAMIVETQQNSDTTYRLYDYGRPRELHIDKGLAAMKEETHAGRVLHDGHTLIASPCFLVQRTKLNNAATYNTRSEARAGIAHCIFALDGAARIEAAGQQAVSVARGDMVIVPAALGEYTVVPQWSFEMLTASLPAGEVAHPQTVLHEAVSAARND